MATRLHIESSSPTPPLSPAYSAQWERTASAARVLTTKTRRGSGIVRTGSGGETSTSPSNGLTRQMISLPLAAQTISGTVKAIIMSASSNAAADLRSQMRIYVVSADGSTVRGVLLEVDNTTGLVSEHSTSWQSRKYPVAWVSPGAALTPVNALVGDRLVIEFGTRALNVSATAYSDGQEIGSTSATYRPEDETNTSANTTPWVEFSQDIDFLDMAEIGAVSAQFVVTAKGPARLGSESAVFVVTTKGPARLGAVSAQLVRQNVPAFSEPHFGSRLNIQPAIAATGSALYIPDSSEFVPFPTETAIGDRLMITYSSGWNVQIPSGWSAEYSGGGGNGTGEIITKIIDSVDLAAGGVTLTTTGGSFPGHANVIRIPGTYGIRVINGAYAGSGYTSIAIAPIAFNKGEIALWITHQRTNAVQSCDRGSLGARQNGSNASGGWWWEKVYNPFTAGAVFTSTTSGQNRMPLGLALVPA